MNNAVVNVRQVQDIYTILGSTIEGKCLMRVASEFIVFWDKFLCEHSLEKSKYNL